MRVVDLRPVVGSRLTAGRHTDDTELAALRTVYRDDHSRDGVRDAGIVACACLSGLRCAELVGLTTPTSTSSRNRPVVGNVGTQRLVRLSPTASLSCPRLIIVHGNSQTAAGPPDGHTIVTGTALWSALGANLDDDDNER